MIGLIKKLIDFVNEKIKNKFIKYLAISGFVSVLGIALRYISYDMFRITVLIIEPGILIGTWVLRYGMERIFGVIKD